MGAVYVVEQVSTGKQRALKLMLPQLVADAALRKPLRAGSACRRAHRGASTWSRSSGPGVDAATNTPWQLRHGSSSSAKTCPSSWPGKGRSAQRTFSSFSSSSCHAVGAAHRVGIVHRDLKPENIFIARSRRAGAEITVKVLDFGIAKIVAEAKTSGTASRRLSGCGWHSEQTDGAPITPATDVWALGLVAFNHMLTGRFFWTAANAAKTAVTQLLREILFESIPSASARANELSASRPFPAALNDWFAHCVVRDPTARFQDASAALHSAPVTFYRQTIAWRRPELIERVEQALSRGWRDRPVRIRNRQGRRSPDAGRARRAWRHGDNGTFGEDRA